MISVIIPARNAASTIRLGVKSVREATSARIEVIVVDDASTDDTAALAEGLADEVIRCERRAGAAAARNLGRVRASGELLVFVDADVRPPPGSIDRLVAGLGATDAAAFGSYGPLPPEGLDNWATLYKNHLHHVTHQNAGPHVSTFWSGFGVVRADDFDVVGGFPLAALHFADVEDIRLGYALTAAGRRVTVVPGAQVDHHKRFSLRRLVATDMLHRAIPWADAMLSTRTFRPELAVSSAAIVSSLAAWAVLVAAGMGLGSMLSPWVAATAGVLGTAIWFGTNRTFLRSAHRSFGARSASVAAAALHALFSLYAPLGAAIGVGIFPVRHLRSRRRPS